MKIRIGWTNPVVRAIALGIMLALTMLWAGGAFHFVYQAY
jgi:hypothetical protein